MTNQEERQLKRVIRNAQFVEQQMFDLVNEMQVARRDPSMPFSWHEVGERIATIQHTLTVAADLVANIKREVLSDAVGESPCRVNIRRVE
jgi:hypothetical protein